MTWSDKMLASRGRGAQNVAVLDPSKKIGPLQGLDDFGEVPTSQLLLFGLAPMGIAVIAGLWMALH
jgi:hypothetical protein